MRFLHVFTCLAIASSVFLTGCGVSSPEPMADENTSTNISLDSNWNTTTAQDVLDNLSERGFTDFKLQYVNDEGVTNDVKDFTQHYDYYTFFWGPDSDTAWLCSIIGGHLQVQPLVVSGVAVNKVTIYEDALFYSYDMKLHRVTATAVPDDGVYTQVDVIDSELLSGYTISEDATNVSE